MPRPRTNSTKIFERYAADGSEIELERWSRRSPVHKLVDQVYYLFNELLRSAIQNRPSTQGMSAPAFD